MKSIKKVIEKGAAFLVREQEKDGSFMCLTSEIFDDYREGKMVPAIVPSSIVLSSLVHLPEAKTVNTIKEKTARFLLAQRSDYWSFNYWFKGSKEYMDIPYPDDLDDTFCALAALYEYEPQLFDGDSMGRITTMLTMAEEKPGGPYNMWLVPKKGKEGKWHDIDLVVNSNIAFFLSLNGIELPRLTAFVEKSIDEDDYEFPYNTMYPGLYFISRFYKGKKVSGMVKLLFSKKEKDGKWQNPLRTALSVSALLNFSAGALHREVEDSIRYLMNTQSHEGGWKPYSFFFQMRLKEKTLYAGASSITTALCLEAINKFEAAKKRSVYPGKEKTTEKSRGKIEKKIENAITQKALQRFSALGPEVRKEALGMLAEIQKGPAGREILLLSHFFRSSLGAQGKSIQDEDIVELGLVNLYGWMAYTIYDDFLDMEGDPKMLPVANVCLRELCGVLDQSMPNRAFVRFYREVLDTVDGANAWEVKNCRSKNNFPDYGDYAELGGKSLGHALGPVALLFKLGFKGNSKEVKNTLKFFRHYLIARQLNDDAHDWQKDLEKGHMTPVLSRLLGDFGRKTRTVEALERLFWNKTILTVCGDISKHVLLAKKSLEKVAIIEDKEILFRLLAPVEASVEKAEKGRTDTKAFLRAYKK